MHQFTNKKKLLFFLILLLGFLFRFNNLNWDSDFHLHPDERFLTMVGTAMKPPSNFLDYFDPQKSRFNPPNIGFNFFVYGIFPVIVNKMISIFFHNDNYNAFTIQGRFLSAVADMMIIFLIFKTVELFEKKIKIHHSIKYWAGFFYAIAVLPIQLSHFFAVDTFLNLFAFASFYATLKYFFQRSLQYMILSAIFFGLAISSKISAIYILPLNVFFIIISAITSEKKLIRFFWSLAIMTGTYFIISYLTIRLADPYLFDSANLLDFKINHIFLMSIKSLESFSTPQAWYPPGIQWIHKTPLIFSLKNIAFFGLGIPYFLVMILGILFTLRRFRIKNCYVLLIMTIWVIGFFIYQSTQFAQSMRYFILLYPFLAILAGFGIFLIFETFVKFLRRFLFTVSCLLLVAIILIWPLAFSSIYLKKHSRVVASEWIYKNIPNNSLILSEYWDDPLPLFIGQNQNKKFIGKELPVFDPDTAEKWNKMNFLLSQADYYILSSNRGWGSVPTIPERFTKMARFYQDLLANKLSYKKIIEFTSYPSLKYLGIPLDYPDDLSDESFTVYDHPKVMIFKNEKKLFNFQ